MRYRILGPLSVTDDGQQVAITAGRDRVVLAMLLLHAGHVVGHDTLVEALWGIEPPVTARSQLQSCVSRLRHRLPAGTIVSDPAGYRLDCGPDDVDATVFARLTAEARASGDRALFREALDLWRGNALIGIDSRPVRTASAALDDQHAAAVEEWAELELNAGGERDLIGFLGRLVERFPLRERLRGLLIRALAGAGRTADALAEFRRARDVLRVELGLEPGRELQNLHRRILAGESGETPEKDQDQRPVRSLPRTVGDFTGRDDVVRRLVRMIGAAATGSPVIAAIDGMAGSGKTTLALHVASLVGDWYPDAHLFVDLYGHGERDPVEPSAALLTLLRQLGVAAEAVPAELDGRVTMWRSELARRRVLVVLDNAYSSSQLTDLLPAAPGSLALVTSRRRLLGLDGVHPESLPVLAAGDATAMLARIAGDRVLAEPEAAAEVVRRCGGLPLALRLAGARLAHRQRWRVADLVRRLGESALPELAAEDRSLANAFALSYQQLAEPGKRMFRLLGLLPAPLFDVLTAAALSGLPLDDAQDLLDDLIDAHLVDEPEVGIFRQHDLLREFAAALAADLSPDERREAIVAVLDLQTHAFAATTLVTAQEVLREDLDFREPLRPDLLAALHDPAARLERERPQLPAYIEAAVATDQIGYAWRLPRAAWRYLFGRGYGDDLRALFGRVLTVVEKAGDRRGIAVIANYLASAYNQLDEYPAALELLDRSLRMHQELGNKTAVARGLGNRAGIYSAMGRFAECVESARASLRLRILAGDRTPTRVALHNLSDGYSRLGLHHQSLHYGRRALMAAIEAADTGAIALALNHIARERRALGIGTRAQAHRYLTVILRLAVRSGELGIEADALSEQGMLLRDEGDFDAAIRRHEAALACIRKTTDRTYGAVYLNELAITRRLAGDPDGALEVHRQALDTIEGRGARFVTACVWTGIADCLAGTDPVEARRLWTDLLGEFRAMQVPEQYDIERRLAAADQP